MSETGFTNIFIGLVLMVTGLVLFLVADRLPRNLLFGFRIGYTLSSRRLWVKYNRLSGLVLLLIGLATPAISLVLKNSLYLTLFIIGAVVSSSILLAYMASREAERELGFRKPSVLQESVVAKKIVPVKPSLAKVLAALAPPLVSIVATFYMLPYLPEYIPVHFNLYGLPDRWTGLEEFLKIVVPYMVGVQCIALVFMAVELKAPMIFYLPKLSKEKFVNLVYDIGIVTEWMLLLLYLNILYYSINNKHFVPPVLMTVLTMAAVVAITVRILLLWMEWRKNIPESRKSVWD